MRLLDGQFDDDQDHFDECSTADLLLLLEEYHYGGEVIPLDLLVELERRGYSVKTG